MDFVGPLNSTKKIIEYGFQLKGVSEESRNAKALLDVVQGDLNELKRLATELENAILPEQQRSIDDIICRTNEVIALMAAPNRRSRKDIKEHGTITIWRRITWTLRDGDTIKMYTNRLLACQSSLNGQLMPLRIMQASNSRGALGRVGTHGLKSNVWEDEESSLAPGSATMTDDLTDVGLWEDWLRDDGGKRKRRRSSASRHSHHRHKHHASSSSNHPQETEREQDFSWLGEHTETEFRSRSHTLDTTPTVSEPPGDISWLADSFNKAEEDDRERRSVSRN